MMKPGPIAIHARCGPGLASSMRKARHPAIALCIALLSLPLLPQSARRSPAPPEAKPDSPYPQLVDITASTGITFEHLSSPDQKYIVESMSGGVALIDYDRDGWLDIYFTNAQSVE